MSSSPAGKRRGSSTPSTDPIIDLRGMNVEEEDVFDMDDDGEEGAQRGRGLRYPGNAPAEEPDPVVWARWDEIGVSSQRR
jgi:hypothetical protein